MSVPKIDAWLFFPQWQTKLFPTSGLNHVSISARSFAYAEKLAPSPQSPVLGLENGDPHGEGLESLP